MIRKALMEYPNYSQGKKEEVTPMEYERFIPDTSSRKHVLVEQKNNTSLGTSATYKNKDLRKHYNFDNFSFIPENTSER
jgi:hypothetical protein